MELYEWNENLRLAYNIFFLKIISYVLGEKSGALSVKGWNELNYLVQKPKILNYPYFACE